MSDPDRSEDATSAPKPMGKDGWLKLISADVTLPNGRRTRLDVIRHPGASAVVPFLGDDEVLLIQQYRHAAGGTIWEVPAGKLDPEEATKLAAALTNELGG